MPLKAPFIFFRKEIKMREQKANQDIRTAISSAGLKQWEAAELLGICEGTFSRWLRRELPEEKKKMILERIRAARR